jgi:hypothetical protein
MPKFVRVHDKRFNVDVSISEMAVRDHHKVLDEPALDVNDKPLRATPHASATKKAAPASTPENKESKEESK